VSVQVVQQSASSFTSGASPDRFAACLSNMLVLDFAIPPVAKHLVNDLADTSEMPQAKSTILTGFSMQPYQLAKVAETNHDICVASITGTALKDFFLGRGTNLVCYQSTDSSRATLSRYAPHGVASGASIPDVALLSPDAEQKPVLLMVIEFKDTSMSPIEQLGQAVVECTNGLISQIHRGISYEQAIELFISTNGHLFQFGCVTLLEPC
jgi:hypothetical protein